jgi:hypothetical protein
MGLIKAFFFALAAGLGIAAERLAIVPSTVAAALVIVLWLVVVHAWRHRAN